MRDDEVVELVEQRPVLPADIDDGTYEAGRQRRGGSFVTWV